MPPDVHPNVAGRVPATGYDGLMVQDIQSKLAMFQAVKKACDDKQWVWRRSAAFQDAFADFCACLDELSRLAPAGNAFQSEARQIDVEITVAETILTTEMDELIELFEPVDVAFVDAYTDARSREPV
jgi:hypothetical protein